MHGRLQHSGDSLGGRPIDHARLIKLIEASIATCVLASYNPLLSPQGSRSIDRSIERAAAARGWSHPLVAAHPEGPLPRRSRGALRLYPTCHRFIPSAPPPIPPADSLAYSLAARSIDQMRSMR